VTPYDHEEIELFFIVDGDLNFYLIPSLVLAGRVAIHVTPTRTTWSETPSA